MSPVVKSLLRGVAMPVLLLAVWETVCRAGLVSPIMLPSPSAIVVKWV